ncbi:transcriptional repressor [Mycobacterium tilburgii]|uniref:transcriptional repressor n=1 Tax=Mycobacterium tilburgii TaxID=44467 RepID=UPI00118317E6|nr:transcriptional repressor [Mycobacterium tilburgii]
MTEPSVRSTRQRAAISTLLETLTISARPRSCTTDLHRRGENIGLTTVYRTLQSMASSGTVDTLRTDTGESVYRRCSDHHHHHLVCRSCGSTIEVGDLEVEKWAAQVAAKHGYSDVSHTIEIFNTCPELPRLPAQACNIRRISAPVSSTSRISVRNASSASAAPGKL